MADFSALKQSIQNYIKQNGNKEITGNLLQNILLSIVTTMGDGAINDNASDISDIQNEIQNIITTRLNTGALYAGYATPSTTPAALTSQEVFYLATQAGTYTNFHFNGGDDPIVLAKDGIYFIVSGSDDDDWNAEPMLQLDDVPTAGSDNPVKSGGIAEMYGSYVENPEFVEVHTDAEDKILWAIQKDGNIYFGAGCPQQVKDYIEEKLEGFSPDEYEDIVTFLSDYLGSDTTLKVLIDGINAQIANKLDAEGLDTDALNSVQTVENNKYIQVTTDSEYKILEVITSEGVKQINIPIDTPSVAIKHVDNPEWIAVELDAEDRIISGVRKDGTVVNYANIEEQTNKSQNPYSVYNDVLINSSNKKYVDITSLGKVFFVHLNNQSEKACYVPIYFCNSSYQEVMPATDYFLGSSDVRAKNIAYGRLYLKSGEDITFPIINPDLYPVISIVQSDIIAGTKIEIEVCTEQYGLLQNRNMCNIPYLGNGRMYIQPNTWNYAHCSRMAIIRKYLLVFFAGANYDATADRDDYTQGAYSTLAIIERGNYNNVVYKRFDGCPSKSNLYGYAAQSLRMCAKEDDLHFLEQGYNLPLGNPSAMYHKKFDSLKFEFADSEKAYLSYNSNIVEWTIANQIAMINAVYGYSIPSLDYTPVETADMRYYNGYFYTVLAGAYYDNSEDNQNNVAPWILMKSSDCVTWEPVAKINPDDSTRSAEISFDIYNDIMLIHIRSMYNYNGYMVYDLANNVILKAPTLLNAIASKGSVFNKDGELYVVYNINNIYSGYYGRTRIQLAKLNGNDYSLTNIANFDNPNGFQYYDLACKDHVVYMSNTEDPRGYNYGTFGPYGGCTLTVLNDNIFNN